MKVPSSAPAALAVAVFTGIAALATAFDSVTLESGILAAATGVMVTALVALARK